MSERAVVITGVGVVHAAVSGGAEALETYLAASASRPGAHVPDLAAHLADGEGRRLSRVCQLAVVAARLALRDAGRSPGAGLGLVVGTELGDLGSTLDFADGFLRRGPSGLSALLFPNTVMNTMAATTAIAVDAREMALTLNAPTVAGELAVARAAWAVASGEVDAVLAGGVDELDARVAWALAQAGADSAEARGEGATFLLLETEAAARARQAPILGRVLGAAWRALPARPHGVGRRAQPRAVHAALAAAETAPEDVGWVYCSASGDRARDAWERRLLDAALAPKCPPATSLAAIGHHAGAGALRVAAAAWTARSRLLPRGSDGTPPATVPAAPGMVHAVARGGTEVALVVGAAA